jgi:chromosome partitioning protein
MVTQPNNDLRSRATSIFERLRGSGTDAKGNRAEQDRADSGAKEPQSEFPPDPVPHPGPPPDPAPPRTFSRLAGVEGASGEDPPVSFTADLNGAPDRVAPTSSEPEFEIELQADDNPPPGLGDEGEPSAGRPTTAYGSPDSVRGHAESAGHTAGSWGPGFSATTAAGESGERAGPLPADESHPGPGSRSSVGGGEQLPADGLAPSVAASDGEAPGEETGSPVVNARATVATETTVVETADGPTGQASSDDRNAPTVSGDAGGRDVTAASVSSVSDLALGQVGAGQPDDREQEGGTSARPDAGASLPSAVQSPAPEATGPPPTDFQLSPPPAPETLADPIGAATHPSARNRPLPRCLAVANQKGGVGKTTTAVNLGAALAELDYRVLVVDLDPQGNATTGLGINARNLDSSIYDVILHDVPVEDVIEPTTLKNLFVVPSTIDLAGAEIELVPVFSRELRLRKALEPVLGDFDFLLIDCPPSLGLLTINGLAAATEVAVPIQCEYYALEGLGQLLRNVGLVQTNLNGDLEVSTIILTMYDARTKLAEQVADEVRQYFGDRVCRNVVPRTVRLSEAPSFGQPIIVFDPSSRGSIAYRELAKEVSGGAPKRTR